MSISWFKVASWHAVEIGENIPNKTLCGRTVEITTSDDLRDDLPAEKSCETCLRIYARRSDGDA